MFYCRLPNGKLVSKRMVDSAMELIAELKDGFEVFEISDTELFIKGDYMEAIRRYCVLNNVSLTEAKAAIDHLRNEWKGE